MNRSFKASVLFFLVLFLQQKILCTEIKTCSSQQFNLLDLQEKVLRNNKTLSEKDLAALVKILNQEKLYAAPSNSDEGQLFLFAIICLFIGGGATYLFMNQKLIEKDAEIAQLKRGIYLDLRF